MKEDLVNIKTALLASDKGFKENVDYCYDISDVNVVDDPPVYNVGDAIGDDELFAPTQSLLQKWLREVHNIFVHPVAVFPIGYETVSYYDAGFRGHHLMQRFESWEEAFEYALVYGLNKIENEK